MGGAEGVCVGSAFVVDWDSHGDFVRLGFAFLQLQSRETFHEIRLGFQVRVFDLLARDHHGDFGVLLEVFDRLVLAVRVTNIGSAAVVVNFHRLGSGPVWGRFWVYRFSLAFEVGGHGDESGLRGCDHVENMAAVFRFVDDARVCYPKLRSEICEPVAAIEAVVEFDVGFFAVEVQYLELACFCGWCGVCFGVVKNDIQITFAMRCCQRIFLCSSRSDEFAVFGIMFFLDCIWDVCGQVQGEVDVFPFGIVVFILPVRVGVWVHVGFACCLGLKVVRRLAKRRNYRTV